MAIIAPSDLAGTGKSLNGVLVAANVGGDKYLNGGTETFIVKNASGGSINVTAVAQKLCSHGVLHNQVFAVAAGDTFQFPALAQDRFNDASGYVNITYSAVASVTVAVTRR